MKYYKRLKIFKASNVTFDPATCRAYSYDWWRFVDRINGFVVFNNHFYSTSTAKHQSKVRSLLRELGIEIDVELDCRTGLQHNHFREAAINNAAVKLGEQLLDNKYARKPQSTLELRNHIRRIKKLLNVRFDFNDVRAGFADADLKRADRLKRSKQLREQRKDSKQPAPAQTPNLALYSNVVRLFG